MARRKIKGPFWPAWRYGPNGEKAIFKSAEEVPEGWLPKPGEIRQEPELIVHPTVELDKDELIAQLLEQGVTINPTWGNAHMKRILDGDISPSG